MKMESCKTGGRREPRGIDSMEDAVVIANKMVLEHMSGIVVSGKCAR